jgi:2'-5' RNA ligase
MVETGPATPLRLFLALWPTEAVRAGLAAWQQTWRWPPRASRVGAERLHITLHFLGDVAVGRWPELLQGLRVPFEPFELRFGVAQVWPGGIAVLNPQETPAALLRLHADLARAIQGLDLPVETRPYRAHVTLSRRAAGAKPPASGPDLSWLADSGYVLVRSLPGGAGYEVLQRFG